MKSTLTILLSLITFLAFSQPTGDIEKDTARANRIYEKAIETKENSTKVTLLKEALKLYEKHPFDDKIIEIYSSLAYFEDDENVSEAYVKQAIDLSKKHLGNTLNTNLYYIYLLKVEKNNVVRSDTAIFYANKILKFIEIPSNHYFELISYLSLDLAYKEDILSLTNITDSLEYFIKEGNDWERYTPLWYRCKMQTAYLNQNYEKAINFGNECIRINEKYTFYDNQSIGPIYVEIANLYAYFGQHQKAIEWIEKGIEIANLPKNSIPLASYNANLSYVHHLNKNFEKAISYALEALAVYENEGDLHSGYIHILNYNIASYYFSLNDFKNATIYLKKSRDINKRQYTERLYARILYKEDKYDSALKVIQETLVTYNEDFDNNDIYINPLTYSASTNLKWLVSTLTLKAEIFILKGVKNKNINAIRFGIETARLSEERLNGLLQNTRGFDRTKLVNNKMFEKISNILLTGQYHLYKILNTEDELNKLFKSTSERKAFLLLETLTPNTLPDSIVVKHDFLANTMKSYEQKVDLASSDSLDFYQALYFEATVALDEFNKEITKEFPKEINSFYNIQYTDINTIQQDLSSDEVIINYNFYGFQNQLLIYILTNKTKDVLEVKVDEDLYQNIMKLNSMIQNPFLIQDANREKFINLSHELYQALIAPIIKELGDKKKLIIIPEGKLFELPFEVLLASNEKKPFHELDFLIKDFDISYQYSATIYHQLKQKQAITDNSFLGFAPVFENGQTIDMASRAADFIVDSLYRSIDNEQFVSLPNTAKEINEITKIIQTKNGQTTTLLKADANKANFLSNIQQQPYQFVHIATHGIVNFQDPKLSALVCHDNTNNVEKAMLFANEIQMQDIQADLVVLSSCESGIGQLVVGEGLIALNRSFIYSGANNVMFSLWKVNDEYTSELMIDFYKFYYQNPSYTSALRQTKLKMLQNPITANPRFWAAFVLIGE